MTPSARAAKNGLAAVLLLACLPTAAQTPESAPEGLLGTTDGAQVYRQICQGCHMPDGRGAVGAGRYPGFVDNPAIASSRYMAVTILAGRRNMPAFAPRESGTWFQRTWLSDEQVANVINYIRGNFGNSYTDPITAADVQALNVNSGE